VHVEGTLKKPKAPTSKLLSPKSGPGDDFVEALAHGLGLLEAWDPGEVWLTNSTLAERSGMTRSSVSRLASVLVRLGYLAADPVRRGRFRLTTNTLELGFGSSLGSEIASCALPELTRLASDLDVYAAISIRHNDRIQIIENVASPLHPDAVCADVGTLLPICRSVSGLAAMSSLPQHEISPLVARLRSQYGKGWPHLNRNVNRSRDEYVEKGYCASVATLSQHVGAVAIPIQPAGSNEVVVLACGMAAHDYYSERIDRVIAPAMLEVAERLSHVLTT
jgi:DNA-binding IclR family transcriptional regulator